MHRGDVNQGLTIGTVSFSTETQKQVTLDPAEHPTDLAPSVVLSPIGVEDNFNAFTSSTVVQNNQWVVTIKRSNTSPNGPDQVNYIIISRIEPKHVQNHDEL
tara:strand:- start:1171 stop:1476 length:306 start_codon:yes stop_codon:yes gene_type:complete